MAHPQITHQIEGHSRQIANLAAMRASQHRASAGSNLGALPHVQSDRVTDAGVKQVGAEVASHEDQGHSRGMAVYAAMIASRRRASGQSNSGNAEQTERDARAGQVGREQIAAQVGTRPSRQGVSSAVVMPVRPGSEASSSGNAEGTERDARADQVGRERIGFFSWFASLLKWW